MPRKFLRVGLAAMIGLLAVVLTGTEAIFAEDKKDEKVPTLKEIMEKGHAKTDGYITKIREAAKDGKWDDAKEYAKTLAFFGENIGKLTPPKGDAKSWEALTKKYADNTKAAHKATETKDVKAVNKALGGINCAECHKVHKGKAK
jgi:hypothetical protein